MTGKIHKEFQEWLTRMVGKGHVCASLSDRERAIFWNAWFCAWQASIDSIVITLPDARDYSDDESAYQAIRDCEIQINLAGLKTDDGHDD